MARWKIVRIPKKRPRRSPRLARLKQMHALEHGYLHQLDRSSQKAVMHLVEIAAELKSIDVYSRRMLALSWVQFNLPFEHPAWVKVRALASSSDDASQ